MRRTVSILFLTAVMGSVAAIGSQPVEWIELTHDFGAINEEAGPVSCQLKFINRGDRPVAVTSASASCGCTTPRFDRHPVAPGDTGIVAVTFDPQGRPGRFAKKVRVDTSDGDGEPLRSSLTIKGVVLGAGATIRSRYPVEAGPLRLRTSTVAFGEVTKNRQGSAFIEAYNPTGDTIRPYFGEHHKSFAPRMVDKAIPPGEQGTIGVVFMSDLNPLYGIVTDSIPFYAGSGDARIDLDAVVIVREDFSHLTPQARAKAPQLKLDPYTVDLGRIDRDGGIVSAQLEIANRGGSPLLIRRIYTTDPGIEIVKAPDKIKKGKRKRIEMLVDPTKYAGELLNARVQIITNDPSQPVEVARIVGEIK